MKKYLALTVVLLLLVFPMISAATSIDKVGLVEKNPNDWSIIPDGNCGGFDYTGDSLVNQRDENYIKINKVDANGDGKYNSVDIKIIRENYQNCKAGNGLIEFASTTSGKTVQQRLKVSVWNLEPITKYQLIEYIEPTNPSDWINTNGATCIGNAKKTSTKGAFNGGSIKFDFLQMKDDGIAQKFWIVLASDVDCKEGKMTVWNPTEYLFEEKTI